MLLDSLHEHLNSPCAVSGALKLTNSDHNQSFSQSESSDVDAEIDGLTCTEDRQVTDVQSVSGKPVESVISGSEQLVLEICKIRAEDSCGFVDSEANSLEPMDCTVMNDNTTTQRCDDNTDSSSAVTVDESGRKVPSIEDFCSKDTKTLNTNVLIEEVAEELAMDSEKFHKIENTAEQSAVSAAESLDDEVTAGGQLHELLLAACDGTVSKPVKETNLVANCREKFVDSMKMTTNSVSAYALTNAADVDCFISSMKQYCGKPAGVTQLATESDDDVQNYDNINNIKRIKIDDQAEKNLRMQAKLKVNTEQNLTRSSSPPVADCTASDAVSVDQLTASSSSSVVMSAGSSHTAQSSALSCAGDLTTARHIRRAEEAWRAYTSRNRSVIVDTFQGQFKSTVSNVVFL